MGQITVSKCYTEDGVEIEGLKVIEPKVFGDSRGYFYEVYNYNDYAAAGIDMQFVQDNQSGSKKGVIRGLHFQKQFPQDKLVRASKGTVFDVAVDLREGSKTFGKWYGVELSDENKKQFFIPKNFAHGFVVLSDTAEFAYKCTDFYHPNDEGGIIWNDPQVGVKWPIPEGMELIFSDKDTRWGTLAEYVEAGWVRPRCPRTWDTGSDPCPNLSLSMSKGKDSQCTIQSEPILINLSRCYSSLSRVI